MFVPNFYIVGTMEAQELVLKIHVRCFKGVWGSLSCSPFKVIWGS